VEKTQLAADTMLGGFNCAQSVIAAFSEDYGLTKEMALRVAGGLGGGMRSGGICGAAIGATLVIGLKNGQTVSGDLQQKAFCAEETAAFLKTFRESHGSCFCNDILGVDMSTEEGRAQAKARNTHNTICIDVVKRAVEILEDMGY
jgi:C_GCAxxG_C_C family probable redox protein